MSVKEILSELKEYGNESTRKIFLKHGAQEPFYGVKVADLKKIQKRIKKDHELSLELYATGNGDAMYLAGLIADEKKITKEELQVWVESASWYMISEYTVPWIAAESPYGFELGMQWIESDDEKIASAGWNTLTSWASLRPNEELDLDAYKKLLGRVEKDIHSAQNRVRYTMNGFVIGVGSYLPDLTKRATDVAQNIGKVSVEMGGTACKVPLAADYIQKVVDRGSLGKKRKKARC
jgi:3-methyladenine DNA glycosylase AlkD